MNNEIKERIMRIKGHSIPEGYISSEIGIIPKKWNVMRIDKCCTDIFLGLTSKVDYVEEGGYPLVRAKDISNKGLKFDEVKYISETQHKQLVKYRRAEKGDVLVSKSGTLGTCCIVDTDREFSIYESIIVLKADFKTLHSKFLLHLLKDESVQNRMIGARVGGTVGHLNLKHFRDLMLQIPPVSEQEKIADILSTWDKAIDLKEQFIEEKKQQKKGLAKRLLTGEVRLSGFEGEWEEVKLGEVINEIHNKTTENNQYPVLTSSRKGIFLQEEYFKKSVSSSDNTGYKIIEKSQFTYRTMSDDGSFKFNQLTEPEIGIVSPAYVVFEAVNIESNYLKFLMDDYSFNEHIAKATQGGTRLSLKYNSLSKFVIKIPGLHEQNAISRILSTLELEIRLIENELDALNLQKKGLMQILLTGIVRVKTEEN